MNDVTYDLNKNTCIYLSDYHFTYLGADHTPHKSKVTSILVAMFKIILCFTIILTQLVIKFQAPNHSTYLKNVKWWTKIRLKIYERHQYYTDYITNYYDTYNSKHRFSELILILI